jgi:hypothetical protein
LRKNEELASIAAQLLSDNHWQCADLHTVLPASATFSRLFGRRFIKAFAGCFVSFLTLGSAPGTTFSARSTAASGMYLTSASSAGFRSSAATRCMRARQTQTTGADQPGNSETGEQFL